MTSLCEVWASACRGQGCLPSFLLQGLSLDLELMIVCRLTTQQALRIHPFLFPQCWGYRCKYTPAFHLGAGA